MITLKARFAKSADLAFFLCPDLNKSLLLVKRYTSKKGYINGIENVRINTLSELNRTEQILKERRNGK